MNNDTSFSGEITGQYLLKEPLHASKNEQIKTSRLCINTTLLVFCFIFKAVNAYLHFMVCQGRKDFEITRSNGI